VVFTRKNSDALTGLVKKFDANRDLKSFVVYLSDDEKMEETLKAYAKTNSLKRTVLTIDNVSGPKSWKISKDAEVTVLLYKEHEVAANFAFGPGELTTAATEKVLGALPKILK
jgi:hypothetical protein